MRTQTICICVVTTAVLAVGASVYRIVPGPGPVAVLDKPSVDLGYVDPGSACTASVAIRNDGTSPLELRAELPSCACTSLRLSKGLLDPGETSLLVATIRVSSNMGTFAHNV